MDAGDPHMETAMKTVFRLALGGAAALVGIACADLGTIPSVTGSLAAFQSVPAGFSSTNSTFASGGDLGEAFQPHRGDGSFDDRGRGGEGRGPGEHGGR